MEPGHEKSFNARMCIAFPRTVVGKVPFHRQAITFVRFSLTFLFELGKGLYGKVRGNLVARSLDSERSP